MQKLEVEEGPEGKKAMARLRAAEASGGGRLFLIDDDQNHPTHVSSVAVSPPNPHLITIHPQPNRTQAVLEARESPYLSPAMKATVAMLESGARVKREALAAATELVRVSCFLVGEGKGERRG